MSVCRTIGPLVILLIAESTFGRTNTVTEEHLKASLLSAVEDKMKRRLKETFAQAQVQYPDVIF